MLPLVPVSWIERIGNALGLLPARRGLRVDAPLVVADLPGVTLIGPAEAPGSVTDLTALSLPRATALQDGYLAAADFAAMAPARGTCITSTGTQVPTVVISVPMVDNSVATIRLTLHGLATGLSDIYMLDYSAHIAIVAGLIKAQNGAKLNEFDSGRITAGGSITGCVDNGAGLIRCTQTGAAGSLSTGMVVTIQGVSGTVEANGTWPIVVIDGTHFDLVGSTFTHTFSGGGSWGRGGGLLGVSWAAGELSFVVQGPGEIGFAWTASASVT